MDDVIPTLPTIPNNLPFFSNKKPRIISTSPWPKSPNMIPNKIQYVIPIKTVGSKSSYAGSPYISINNSNGLKNQLFFNSVGHLISFTSLGSLILKSTGSPLKAALYVSTSEAFTNPLRICFWSSTATYGYILQIEL